MSIPTTSYAYAITSTATSVYVTLGNNTNPDTTAIAQYAIQSDGKLTSSPASTVNLSHFTGSLTVTANGKYAFAPNYIEPSSGSSATGSAIYEYSINASGALVSNGTLTLPATVSPFKVVIDANSKYAYVPGVESNISQFTIGSTGTLTAMATPKVTTTARPRATIIDPTNKYVYVGGVGSSNGITQYSIGTDGGLSQLSFLSTSAGVEGIALH